MADQNNTGITDGDIQKTKEYTEVLDKLQSSLGAVNSKLPAFSEGLEAGLSAIAEKMPEVIESLTKINLQNKELAASGQKPKSVLAELASSFFSWNNVLSAAITLITAYGPKILSFIGNLFESKKARDAAQALKDYKDVWNSYNQTIIKESGELDNLLAIAKNEKIAKEARLEAIRKLNALAPEYLGTLTLANVAMAKGTDAVNEYVKALKRKAIEEATQVKRTELTSERMAITEEYQKRKARVDYYRKGKLKDKNFGRETVINTNTHVDDFSSRVIDYAADAEKDFKIYADKDKEILARVKTLNDTTAHFLKGLEPKAAAPVTLAGKAYWDKMLSDQQTELNKLDANAKDFEANAKPIIDRIKQTKKILSGYEEKPEKIKPSGTNTDKHNANEQAEKELKASKDREAELLLDSYAQQIELVNKHFADLKEQYKANKGTVAQLEKERLAALADVNKNYQDTELKKLDEYQNDLHKKAKAEGKNAQELATAQLKAEHEARAAEFLKIADKALADKIAIQKRQQDLRDQRRTKEADDLNMALKNEEAILTKANAAKEQSDAKYKADEKKLDEALANEQKTKQFENDKGKIEAEINTAHDDGNWKLEFDRRGQLLNLERTQAEEAAKARNESVAAVDDIYKKKQLQLDKAKLDAQSENNKRYLKSVDSLSTAITGIFGKNTIAARVAFKAHQAAAAAQVIIDTKRSVMGIWAADAPLPFIGVAKAIAETAIVTAAGASSLASIIKQKPGFAQGGQYVSDGRGAILPGYSRTDDTNAYLRSGEAVVVSEAMRNPWARNLVSAINVAHGGRDFSVANPNRGYAIGGIFTDGGNANRYYSQPANDVKDLANTLAYQMINNFPPIYVDVKDVNSQQNILAQTVNRVNL